MKLRSIYTILGAIVGAVVDLLINLVAAGIQQHAFTDQFSIQTIWGLVGLTLVGIIVGYWLGKPLQVPVSSSPQATVSESPDTVTITRMQALWSQSKLKGKGIHLKNIFSWKSTLDINTKD